MLVDRAKDMIIRGGENIYPKEIETVVYRLPGAPRPPSSATTRRRVRRGTGHVRLATSPGHILDVTAFVNIWPRRLSKYKRPAEITILDVPKNAVGKIDKPTLRKRSAAVGHSA